MKDCCMNCIGSDWVCESHPDRPWGGVSDALTACNCGGAGSPCPVCNREMAFAGMKAATIQECAAVAKAPFDWKFGEAPTTYRALANRIGDTILRLQFVDQNAPRTGGVFSTEAIRERLSRPDQSA